MKIANLSPKNLQILGQKTRPEAATEPLRPETMNLTVGRLLEARVTGFTKDGNLLLDLDGRTLAAKSLIPLEVGETLWLEVKQTGPPPVLALAEGKAAIYNLLRLLFSHAPQFTKTIATLPPSTGPESSPNKIDQPALGNRLVSLLKEINLSSQPDIAKVIKIISLLVPSQTKGSELPASGLREQLQNVMLGQDPGANSPEARGIASLLEAMQNINSHASLPENPSLFIFPCFSEAGWGEWMVFVDQEKDHAAGQTSFTLEFFLEMSRLGEIHLQTIFNDKGVKGSFSVASEEALEHLKPRLAELKKIIEDLGYGPVSLTCRKSKETVLQKLKDTLEEKAEMPSVNIVDIKA